MAISLGDCVLLALHATTITAGRSRAKFHCRASLAINMSHNAPLHGSCGGCAVTLMNINEIERVLAAEPRNVRALILKADHLANAGDARSASSYYLAALKAAGPPQQAPGDLLSELQRARSMYERYVGEYQEYIVGQLTARGFDPASSSKRFAAVSRYRARQEADLPAAAALLLFPGTAADPVLRARAVPVAGRARAETDAICAELQAVMQQPAAFAPYVQGDAQPSAERAGGHAEQSGVERLLSVEERRGGSGERRTLSAHDASAAKCAAGARAEPLAVDPVFAVAARARTFRRTTAW